MDFMDIEIFLSIVTTRNLSKTADTLFLSQSTVSHRLRLLEKELGCSLIVRSKGIKKIELTPEGNAFFPIAERIFSLWKESGMISHSLQTPSLTVGCTDSINIALLMPFYKKIVQEKKALDLNIRTHWTTVLYDIVNMQDIDVALVNNQLFYKNIICEQIFEENFYLVQSCNPAVPKPLVHTNELDLTKQLYSNWDETYQIWHNQWLGNKVRCHYSVDTVGMLSRLWNAEEQYWMIAPESVICELYRDHPLYVSRLVNLPPSRCCHKIRHRSPRLTNERSLAIFEQELKEYLSQLKFEVHIGEIWKNQDT